jgi:heptosyltransferase-2
VKFLIIQTAFIGDVILATAVLEKLHKFYPGAQIDLLVQKGNESLFDGHPFLTNVIVFDKNVGRFNSLFALIPRIRREHYDTVINLHRFFSSGLITILSGALRTIGFDKNPLSYFFSTQVAHEISATGTLHEVQRNLLLISRLTDETSDEKPKLYPPLAAFEKVRTEEQYICIAPASIWYTKQWPAERWVALINALEDRYLVYLLGSKQDRDLCEGIRNAVNVGRVETRAGELSLLESAALMNKAARSFVNDSAPMHLASAVNAPVTAVFCSTVPAFGFGSLSDNATIAETIQPLSCRPCGLHGHMACPEGHFKCAEIDVHRLITF